MPNNLTFPPLMSAPNIVYVIYFQMPARQPVPFYVGQSGRGLRRMGDYITATFAAVTDYFVGNAIREFQNRGATVSVQWREVEATQRRKQEKAIMDRLMAEGHRLLNDVPRYNYKTAVEADVLRSLRGFIETVLEK